MTASDSNVAVLALQIALGLVQLVTFLLVRRVHQQTSMRPPAYRTRVVEDDEDETPSERKPS